MSNSIHAENGRKRRSEQRATLARVPALDNAGNAPSGPLARGAGIGGALAERRAALAIARAYLDDTRYYPGSMFWAPIAPFWRARYFYRMALGLESMDCITGEA